VIVPLGYLFPLSRLPAAGGTPQPLSTLDSFVAQRWPQSLTGRDVVIFTATQSVSSWDNADIEAVSLENGKTKVIQRGGYFGRYLPTGHLVYVHQGVLMGVKFDPKRREVRGTPVPILENLGANPVTGGGQFDFSNTGTLVYAEAKNAVQKWNISWLDGTGKQEHLLPTLGIYVVPRISPDGRKLAFIGDGSDVYIHDLERDATSRITFTGHAANPVWAPDSRHIVFQSTGDMFRLYWMRSDGSGDPVPLIDNPGIVPPQSFSPEGQLAYLKRSAETGVDIWTLSLDLNDPDHPKPGKPEPFLNTPADESAPRFSPDGHWIAYRSNETGDSEIYVRPFPPGNGGKWQISNGGGLYVIWSKNGHELFYETADNRIMVVDYKVGGASFEHGKPRLWSDERLFHPGTANLDLAPDGKRFVVLTRPEGASAKGSVHVNMLFNFFDEVKRRIP
jgi:serine/threonine-protein kinase